jgi:hypothetical protein
MSQLLIDRSPDLKRLRDEGYEIEVKGGYLLIHQIPYVNGSKEVCRGILVSDLSLVSNTQTVPPQNHVSYFIGEHPCNSDGSPITSIKHSSQNQVLAEGIVINHSFSNKPAAGYPDYYQKMTRYISIISDQAFAIDKNATPRTFKVIQELDSDSVHHYMDTNTSRANIYPINSKLTGHKVAIIGVGGTGSYILDLIAKTWVTEIHLFDGDIFCQHNSFRSPGAPSIELLDSKMKKVIYMASIYSNIHKHIFSHDYYIHEENIIELNDMSFVFISVDKDSVRKLIIDHLLKTGVPFADVGLGVNLLDDSLLGSLRVTVGTKDKHDHLASRIPSGNLDNDEYGSNIQIADLNSLNAVLAVIRWKKMFGLYQDLKKEHHTTYSINVGHLNNEDFTA